MCCGSFSCDVVDDLKRANGKSDSCAWFTGDGVGAGDGDGTGSDGDDCSSSFEDIVLFDVFSCRYAFSE